MSEAQEVARAIYEAHPEWFPLASRRYAVGVATGQCPEESIEVINAVADALLEIKPDESK